MLSKIKRLINAHVDALAETLEKYAYDAKAYREADGAYWRGYADGCRDMNNIKRRRDDA